MSFFDPLLGAIGHGTEVTQLDVVGYGVEVPGVLALSAALALTWTSSVPMAPRSRCTSAQLSWLFGPIASTEQGLQNR